MGHKTNKKIGGLKRAQKAREDIVVMLQDDSSSLYYYKDIELARKYNVSRHTIYKIRHDYDIPSRSVRIAEALKKIDANRYTIKELSKKLGIKYQNLYRIVKDLKIRVKPDTPPIESLKKYVREGSKV